MKRFKWWFVLNEQVNPGQVDDALFKEQIHTNSLFFSNNINSTTSPRTHSSVKAACRDDQAADETHREHREQLVYG